MTVSCTADGDLYKVEVKGASGHAASPEAGNNALTALLRLMTLLPLARSEVTEKMHVLADLFPHGDWGGKALKVDMSDEESGDLTLSLDVLNYKDGKIEGIFDCRAPLTAEDFRRSGILHGGGRHESGSRGQRGLLLCAHAP